VNDCSPETTPPVEVALQGSILRAELLNARAKADVLWSKRLIRRGLTHQTKQTNRNAAGHGSKRLYTDCGDNVGKDHLPAGADSNLPRPTE